MLKHKIFSLHEVQEETAAEQEETAAPAARTTATATATVAVKEEKENNTEATLGNIGQDIKWKPRMVYLDLQLGEGPLKDALSLDGTHVNAKIIPYIEQASEYKQCRCDA